MIDQESNAWSAASVPNTTVCKPLRREPRMYYYNGEGLEPRALIDAPVSSSTVACFDRPSQ